MLRGDMAYAGRIELTENQASATKSMGGFRLGEASKLAIERSFEGFIGPETARFSAGEFCVAVHTLDDPECDLSFRRESVQQKRAVSAQGSGEALHR